MLTTITTTTTTTTTTAAAAFGAIGVVILIMLLIAKELLSAYGDESEGGRAEEVGGVFVDTHTHAKVKLLATSLNAAIYPLLFSFALIVIMKVVEVL